MKNEISRLLYRRIVSLNLDDSLVKRRICLPCFSFKTVALKKDYSQRYKNLKKVFLL